MKNLLKENVAKIYKSEKIKSYEKMAQNTVEGLFTALMAIAQDEEKLQASDIKTFKNYYEYITERECMKDDSTVQKVMDFIAGMTDSYAQKCYEEIYWF